MGKEGDGEGKLINLHYSVCTQNAVSHNENPLVYSGYE